jgi:UDP-N-acetylmuramoyl-L-alanyl-D-glutamate--2,6-diaminopimelate ligase
MTWAELHGALRGRGLIQADDALRAEAAVGVVTGVAYDSRTVTPGQVFVALKGQHADGTAFARQAIERGAAAVVSEQPAPDGVHVPWAIVGDARLALAVLAAAFYRDPSREMRVIGITGTNGKTTTAYLVASIFDAAGIRCGILGTVGYRVGDEVRDATRTTPEAPEVQALLREMVDKQCGACAMEVSSHALSLRRVAGITFAAGVFTNLTRDHLDFHADMDDYFRAKRRLFEMLPRDAPSLINLDDPRGASLVEAGGRPLTYAINRQADVMPGPLSFSLSGLAFDVRTPSGTLHVTSKLVGRPNVYNILAAVSAATALDVPAGAIERGLASLDGVPGRFQVVSDANDEVTVVVDYAHTDDALRNLLETARPLTPGRMITVFGCGGDRDRTKRPLMGAVAGRLSDLIVLTSDNPRGEDPNRIIEEVQRGITPDTRRDSAQRLLTIVDRHAAIAKAIELARPGDVVLVAGKGHEKYQVIGDRALPFDDVAVAREALARRRTKSSVAK